MKTLITLLFFLLTRFCFAQKTYKFDYVIETEKTFFKEDSVTRQFIYLTNSKDNSYYVRLTPKDSLHYHLVFRHYDTIYSKVFIQKPDLIKAEFINITCDDIHRGKNRYKKVAKNYKFVVLMDTLIQNKIYDVYKLTSTYSPKKRKRKHAGTNLYIIDPANRFHMPLLIHGTALENYINYYKLPYGFFTEKKFINHLEEEHSSEKLISFSKIDNRIVIPNDCFSPK